MTFGTRVSLGRNKYSNQIFGTKGDWKKYTLDNFITKGPMTIRPSLRIILVIFNTRVCSPFRLVVRGPIGVTSFKRF